MHAHTYTHTKKKKIQVNTDHKNKCIIHKLTGVHTHTHTLHGHSSPDPKRSRVPSPVRSESAARITFQLHAHTYMSSVKLHYNTTKTQTTTTMIFLSLYILQLLGCSGAATNIKVCGPSHKRSWNINGCLVLFFHSCPTSSTRLRCPPSPTARTSRACRRRSHFLFFITGTWHPLLHHWKTLLLSPHLRPLPIRVSDCIHIWS